MVKTIGSKHYFIHENQFKMPGNVLCQTNYLNHVYISWNITIPIPPYDSGIIAVFKIKERFE